MKLRFFSIFALAGLLLNSCAVEEVPVTEHTILAVMEGDQTRTSVTDEGVFSWSAGDQVWLQTTNGSVVGTLSSGAGTSRASFSTGAFIGDLTGKAVYPYNLPAPENSRQNRRFSRRKRGSIYCRRRRAGFSPFKQTGNRSLSICGKLWYWNRRRALRQDGKADKIGYEGNRGLGFLKPALKNLTFGAICYIMNNILLWLLQI